MIRAIGCSIINETSTEIAYLYLQEIVLKFSLSNMYRNFELQLQNVHLDNQMYNTLYPVVFTRTNISNTSPFVHLSVCQSVQEKNVLLFPYFSFNIQKSSVSADYSFIANMLGFVNKLKFSSTSDERIVTEMLETIFEPQLVIKASKKLYFHILELHPIQVNVTFKYNKHEFQQVDGESNNALTILLDSIGITVSNVDNAPIKLNALILEHPFVSMNELIDRLKKHYTRAGIIELYKIIGSLDVLGNPVGLFNDIGTGVKDFFYEPAAAITKSPLEFTKGIVKGTSSLLSKSLHGTFNTASKVTGVFGKSIKLLTFDNEYIRASESRKKPRHISEGLKEGGEAFLRGAFHSVSDIITKPIEGANKEGVYGLVKNLSLAIIGAPVKPIAGVFDFAQRATEGISNSQREFHTRVRHPRVFREDGALIPYCEDKALTMHVQYELQCAKIILEGEKVWTQFLLAGDHLLVVTTSSLVCVSASKLSSLQWRQEFATVTSITKMQATNTVVLNVKETRQGLFGASFIQSTRTIVLKYAQDVNLLVQVLLAVQDFTNKRK